MQRCKLGALRAPSALFLALAISGAAAACNQGGGQGGTQTGEGAEAGNGGGNVTTSATEPNATEPAVGTSTAGASPNNTNQLTPTVAQQPNGAAIQYLGRFDTTTDPNLVTMAWPSSQILIGFEGTRLVVTLNSLDSASYGGVAQNAWVAASVDDQLSTHYKLATGTNSLALAQNLTLGHHTVRIIQRTEAQMGRVAFVNATTDGKLSYTPAASGRRIEFVGDSGAAGYGADGNYPCTFSAATENGEAPYPYLVGKLLNAEVRNLSYSGKGLVENRDMVNDAYKTLPVLWQRTLPFDNPYVLWDTNAWHPQVVVLITGGNDFYNEIPAQATYVNTVTSFVNTLKTSYPGVRVYLAASPMLRDDSHPTQREVAITYLKLIASQAADPNVLYLDVPGPDLDTAASVLGINGFGCDEHPTAATHVKVAASMAATIKAQMGW